MKKGYTLIEILVALTIILVLSTLGIFAYQRCLAYARETVCKVNLRALEMAIEFYVAENDALPASLGDLKLEHLKKGYAKAMKDKGWFTKFSYFLIKLHIPEEAYAQFLTYENLKNYGATEEIFHCPADYNGGASYGINGNLVSKKWSDVNEGLIIVADCDNYVFTTVEQLAKRHKYMALAIRKNNEIVEVDDDQGDDDDDDDDDIKDKIR